MYHPILQSLENRGWVSLIVKPSLLWLSLGMALVAIRTLLWACYRPQPESDYYDAPRLTVIIPAYNEGAMVQRSIHSCAKANYPRDRIEIIVIDDGSVDDTWEHIERSAQAHPGLVRTVRFERNRGKREALAAGFRMASGEVVVTVDSDSIIESGTLLAVTGPFRDERVGAVAGKVSVLNRYSSLLPRMLHVQYVLSFDFLRSAQSAYGAVCCCPGALSAYRTSLVRKFLEPWVNQKFLGAACTTGEDRALTNNILNLGYKTVYQRTAVVHTLAPETYMRLCRMFLRWDRSYIREEIRLLKIMWKLPVHSLLLTMVDKTITNLRFPVAYVTSALLVFLAIHDP
ncbi:MAG: glycosyltransferase family 2 protein, partial [Desulfuromonadales bacterium]